MNFSLSYYNRLKSRLITKYQSKFKKEIHLQSKFDSKLYRWLIKHEQDLREYSPLHWYFLQQIAQLNFFLQNHSKLSDSASDFASAEDEVFEKWNHSEFADNFLKALNKGHPVKKASELTSRAYEAHIIALGNRFILKSSNVSSAYRIQTSLGETLKNKVPVKLLETTLHIEGTNLKLMTSSLKEMKLFSPRIEAALKNIRDFSPSSWDRFKSFTDTIIPIKQKEFVSYSHQELPGTSMINLYDRDSIDLMDDLLHENGHHHLNYYLNFGKLIDEPQDCIYYSPWRRTLRPLRGVYHAYFTFFWAFKLFSDLLSSKEFETSEIFSPDEKEKIYWRAIEEFLMLDYTSNELKWAKKQGLINELGWELIEEQKKILQKFRKKIPLWEKKLKAHKSDLKDLKKILKLAEKNYLKL